MKLIKKNKLDEKKIEESHDLVFQVVFVNSTDSVVVNVDSRHSDLDKLRNEVHKEFLKQDPNASDDFWIDDISLEKGSHELMKLDWNKILNAGGNIDEELFEMILEDPDNAIKIQYLVSQGYDVDEDTLEEVYVYDASHDRQVEGNYKALYPEGWIDEVVENFYSDLQKELQKYNAEGYMDFASLISDNEVNGDFDSSWIGDYFVYRYR